MHVDVLLLALCAWLLTYALHSSVLIALAWLSSSFLSRIQSLSTALAPVRERLWKTALVAGIATATLQTALGGGPWDLVAESDTAATIAPKENTESVVTLPASASTVPSAVPSTGPNVASNVVPNVVPVFLDSASLERTLNALRRENSARRAHPATAILPAMVPSAGNEASSTALEEHAAELGTPSASFEARGTELQAESTRPEPRAAELERTGSHTLSLSSTWIRALICVWIGGVLLGLARWALDWRRLVAALRGRARITSGPAREVFDELVKRAGVGSRVSLFHAPCIAAPITIGLLEPAICLPPRAESELQRDELEALLAHELAHALRRDPAWLCACRAIEVSLFFQPLNRLARVHLADEAEYMCDDWAVRHTRERLSLASCLTEIAGWIVGRERELSAPAMAARGSRLELRVRRVLEGGDQPTDDDGSQTTAARWMSPLACGAVGAVAFLVPGVSVRGGPSASARSDVLAESDVPTRTDTMADASIDIDTSRSFTQPSFAESTRTTPSSAADAVDAAENSIDDLADAAPAIDDHSEAAESANTRDLEAPAVTANIDANCADGAQTLCESKAESSSSKAEDEPHADLNPMAASVATMAAPSTLMLAPFPMIGSGAALSGAPLTVLGNELWTSLGNGSGTVLGTDPAATSRAKDASAIGSSSALAPLAESVPTIAGGMPSAYAVALTENIAALADVRAFEADIATLEESMKALKTEISQRRAPPEFQRRMKTLEEDLRTLRKHRTQLALYLTIPTLRVVAPEATRTDDHPTTKDRK